MKSKIILELDDDTGRVEIKVPTSMSAAEAKEILTSAAEAAGEQASFEEVPQGSRSFFPVFAPNTDFRN